MGHPHYHPDPLGDWHLDCKDPWMHIEELRTTLNSLRLYVRGDTNCTGHAIDSLMELLPDPDDYPDPEI